MHGKFYIDNLPSTSLGLYAVGIGSGDDTLSLLGAQDLTEVDVINREYSSFIRTRKNNINFTLYFILCDENGNPSYVELNTDRLSGIGKYLARSIPVELKFQYGVDASGRDVYRCIKAVPTGGVDLVRFGDMKGYFAIPFTGGPYWTTEMEVLEFALTASGAGSRFVINNRRNIQDSYGNYDVFPKIEIRNIQSSGNNFILNNETVRSNNTNSSAETRVIFNSVLHNDTITMHHRIVHSRLDEDNIFHKWGDLGDGGLPDKQPFYLTEGANTVSVNRACTVVIYLQVPII